MNTSTMLAQVCAMLPKSNDESRRGVYETDVRDALGIGRRKAGHALKLAASLGLARFYHWGEVGGFKAGWRLP